MRYIFVMSLGGSLLVVFYCLTHNKKVCFLSVHMQDILLKGVMLFYLVPLLFLKPLYRELSYLLWKESFFTSTGVWKNEYYYSVSEGTVRANEAYAWQMGSFFLWFFVALVIFGIRIFRYEKRKKQLLGVARQIKDGISFELLEKIRKEMNIKRDIRLYDTQAAALTMGLLRPVICFDSRVPMEQLELTLRHECMHIRRMDALTGQLVQLAMMVHWFNPVIYLLPKKLGHIIEFCCDDAVVGGTNGLTRAEYAKMLLEQMVRQPTTGVSHNALSENGEKVKERIQRIMKPKTRTKLQNAVAIVVLSVVFFMDSWTVMAYPDVIELDQTFSDAEFHADADYFFVEDGAEGPLDITDDVVLYDKQFVDEEGNIYSVQEEIATAALCFFHNWVSGQVQEHVVNNNGGCTNYVYEAERCTKCGKIKQGDLINTVTYEVCIH